MGSKAVILAAGVGSRLGNGKIPKPLTRLANGKTILQEQVIKLESRGSIEEILIVVGFRQEMVIDAFPSLTFVYSPDFAQENTSKSLLRALQEIDGDDVLWLNGDVVFKEGVLDQILKLDATAMVVNQGEVDEEAVKYRSNSSGSIVEVSKTVSNSQGEALGINLFKAEDVKTLKRHLIACHPQDYFEKGIEACILNGVVVQACVVDQTDCVEVDFPKDLKKANLVCPV